MSLLGPQLAPVSLAGAGLGVCAFFLGEALWGIASGLLADPKPVFLCNLAVRQAQWDSAIRNFVVGGGLGAAAAITLHLALLCRRTEQAVL